MKKISITTVLLALTFGIANAQTTNKAITEHDPAVRAKDSTIKADIIGPMRELPDWAALTKTITEKFDATTADRTITKAKIYYYYAKDKAQFCAGIVHYTDNFELADDYKLLNLNAGMILKNSSDQGELKEALKWAKSAADSDPGNTMYQQIYKALKEKLNQ